MKIIDIIIIFFCLFSFSNLTCSSEDEEIKIRGKDDCNKRTFSDVESNEGAYKCCYLEEEIDTITQKGTRYSCIAISQNDYIKIKDVVKQYESYNGVDDVKIKCKSSYLQYGLFSLILILL